MDPIVRAAPPPADSLSSLLKQVSDLEKSASRTELAVATQAHALVTAQAKTEGLRQQLLERARAADAAAVMSSLAAMEIPEIDLSDEFHRKLHQRMDLARERLRTSNEALAGLTEQQQYLHETVTPRLQGFEAQVADAVEMARSRRAQARAELDPRSRPDEARQHERASLASEVSWNSEDNFYTGFSGDISEGGVFVTTINLLDIGQSIEVELRLPSGAHIKTTGTVQWIREWNDLTPFLHPGMGIQFTNLPADQQAAIATFVAEREPLFYVD